MCGIAIDCVRDYTRTFGTQHLHGVVWWGLQEVNVGCIQHTPPSAHLSVNGLKRHCDQRLNTQLGTPRAAKRGLTHYYYFFFKKY